MGWQKASGHSCLALVEADIRRCKRVIGGGFHSCIDGQRATNVALACRALSRLLDLERLAYVRII